MEPLTVDEARVVACLVEKQRTVPDTYPLTLNALVAACNQSTSRDPILHLEAGQVLAAIDSLKARGLARIVHPSAGSRSTKYRHVLGEALALDDGPLALLTVLLLRGPQTAAELRTRTERLHAFADQGDVDAALESLVAAGHVERHDSRRWRQTLSPSGQGAVEPFDETVTRSENDDDPGLGERVTALEAEVAELRAVVDRLRQVLD